MGNSLDVGEVQCGGNEAEVKGSIHHGRSNLPNKKLASAAKRVCCFVEFPASLHQMDFIKDCKGIPNTKDSLLTISRDRMG